jgi:hypothetical protein
MSTKHHSLNLRNGKKIRQARWEGFSVGCQGFKGVEQSKFAQSKK